VHVVPPPPALAIEDDGPYARSSTGLRIRNDALGIQSRVALLPDTAATAPFNDAITQLVRGAIDGRVAASGTAYTPEVLAAGAGLASRRCVAGSTERDAAELLADAAFGPGGGHGTALVCDVVAASGPFFGERVRVVAGGPDGVTADAATILYSDTATGELATADALWAQGAAEALSADIVEALRRDAGALTRRPASAGDAAQLAAVTAALATTVPDADGFVITLAAGFVAPELAALGVAATAEPMTLAVPAGVAATLVTPFGARLLAASAHEYTGPALTAAGSRAVDCTLVPCVAVTYDDGPSGFTAGILDELAARDAAATFFAQGVNAGRFRDVLARMTREGHEVANHTWNHPHLPGLAPKQVAAQIADTSRALEAASGQPIRSFRPPYGEYDATVLAAAGLPAILWDVDTEDWRGPSDEVLIRRAVDGPRPGSIVLQHDVHAVTARTAGAVYDGLLDRGFTMVTVRQLFGGELPSSGAWRRTP
jgi:peptidoglycan/xylan/chitin deacetylase (PgdA/CDA1 family)